DVRQRNLLDQGPARGVLVEEDEVARAAEVHAAIAALDGDQVARGKRLLGGFDEGDPVRGSRGVEGERRVRDGRGPCNGDEVAAGAEGRAGEGRGRRVARARGERLGGAKGDAVEEELDGTSRGAQGVVPVESDRVGRGGPDGDVVCRGRDRGGRVRGGRHGGGV